MSDRIQVGEPFALPVDHVGDCDGEYQNVLGFFAVCVLDEGHAGPHVASDGTKVVEVWD